jgi:hypothetical protein
MVGFCDKRDYDNESSGPLSKGIPRSTKLLSITQERSCTTSYILAGTDETLREWGYKPSDKFDTGKPPMLQKAYIYCA